MEKPEDIPEDVWDRAIKVELSLPGHSRGSIGDVPNLVAVRAIARAILSAVEEEREACAAIAQNYDGLGRYPSEGSAYGDASLTQLDIAEIIRNRGTAR